MIMKTHAILAGLCVFLAPQSASALQLTNRDTTNYKLIIAELNGGAKKELETTPSQIIEDICLKGCTITMPDGQEYEFEGNEIVSIEEGLIFLDGPDDLTGPSEGADEGAETEDPPSGTAN
jgi:hypothetical protein